jgi:hypothetical protein
MWQSHGRLVGSFRLVGCHIFWFFKTLGRLFFLFFFKRRRRRRRHSSQRRRDDKCQRRRASQFGRFGRFVAHFNSNCGRLYDESNVAVCAPIPFILPPGIGQPSSRPKVICLFSRPWRTDSKKIKTQNVFHSKMKGKKTKKNKNNRWAYRLNFVSCHHFTNT